MRPAICALVVLLLPAGLSSAGTAQQQAPRLNGRILVVVDGGIFSMNPDGSARRALTSGRDINRNPDRDPAASPDGRRIAFASLRDGRSEIYVMRADGSRQTRLTRDATSSSSPSWSPDSTKLVYEGYGGEPYTELFVMNADGTDVIRLTRNSVTDRDPQWSPDGKTIVFVRSASLESDLYSIRPDGSGERQLTSGKPAEVDPEWSPDGTQIAFAVSSSFSGLYVMNADGSGSRELNGPAGEGRFVGHASPEWSPDGRTIAFRRYEGPHGPYDDVYLHPGYVRITFDERTRLGDWSAAETCRVPRLAGMRLASARAAIKRAGCSVGRMTFKRSRRPGRVLSQRPRPRILVLRGTAVHFVMGRRPRR